MGSVIDALVGLVGAIFGGIVVNILFDELVRRQPQFLTWCLRCVARQLPEHERSVRIEEWAADLHELPSHLSKLYRVGGFALAAFRISRDIKRERRHTLARISIAGSNAAEVRKATRRVRRALDAKLAKLRAEVDACAWGEERAQKLRHFEAVSQQLEEQALEELREQLNSIGKR